MPETKEQWERLPELFAFIEQQMEEGKSPDEIAAVLREIDKFEWACTIAELREAGVPEGEIALWIDNLHHDRLNFNDDDPLDAVDANDQDYEPSDQGLATVEVLLIVLIILVVFFVFARAYR